MNRYLYQILMGASLAALVGAVGAQSYGDQPSSVTTGKNAPQNVQAQPSAAPSAAPASTSGGDAPYTATDKNLPQATQDGSFDTPIRAQYLRDSLMEYKDTLNLPKTDFSMKADLVIREPQRLEKWYGAK